MVFPGREAPAQTMPKKLENDTGLPTSRPVAAARSEAATAPRVGRLQGERQGEVLVEVPGAGTRQARLVAGLDRGELLRPENRGREVLLVFEEGDLDRPIVLDLLESPLGELLRPASAAAPRRTRDAFVDGRRVVIEADQEVVLKCGKGSITIRADGRIVVKGTRILSRAEGLNRIKGGSVQIN